MLMMLPSALSGLCVYGIKHICTGNSLLYWPLGIHMQAAAAARADPVTWFWGYVGPEETMLWSRRVVLAGCKWLVACWTPWRLWIARALWAPCSPKDMFFKAFNFALRRLALLNVQQLIEVGAGVSLILWARIQSLFGSPEINVAEQVKPEDFP